MRHKSLFFFFLFASVLLFSAICDDPFDPKKDYEYGDKEKKAKDPLPPSRDFKRCKENDQNCIEYEFFSYKKLMYEELSLKQKIKKVNKFLRSSFSGWQTGSREYYVKEDEHGRIGLFTQSRINPGDFIFRFGPLHFIHEEYPFTYGFTDIDRTYLVAAVPPITFFRPVNQIIHKLLFQFAWILDSPHEKWISLIPYHKLSPFITMTAKDLELLKQLDNEAYSYAMNQREKLIEDYFEYTDKIDLNFMGFNPLVMGDFYRRPNVTMSDYVWAWSIVHQSGFKSDASETIGVFPFLDFIYYKEKDEMIATVTEKPFFDVKSSHEDKFVLKSDRVIEEGGQIFNNYAKYLRPNTKNYILMLSHGIVENNNPLECVQILLIPKEKFLTLNTSFKRILMSINLAGTSICYNTGFKIPERLKVLFFLLNLENEQIDAIYHHSTIGWNADSVEEKVRKILEIMPKPKEITTDFTLVAIEDIAQKRAGLNEKLKIIEDYRNSVDRNEINDFPGLIEKYIKAQQNLFDTTEKILIGLKKDFLKGSEKTEL